MTLLIPCLVELVNLCRNLNSYHLSSPSYIGLTMIKLGDPRWVYMIPGGCI